MIQLFTSLRITLGHLWAGLIVLAMSAGHGIVNAQPCEFGSELLPFVPRAGWPDGLQGFVRLVNRRSTDAELAFTATDDAGNSHDLTVRVPAERTLHFNSEDLEFGNAEKGELSGTGTGSARGHWRLCFRLGNHNIAPTGYIRTTDGFLTDMTLSVAPDVWDCSADGPQCAQWIVPIFNPASNTNQVSRLRIINNDDAPVALVITGIREDGTANRDSRQEPRRVSGEIPPLTAQEFTAEELETGTGLASKLEPQFTDAGDELPLGDIGPARGKWQLQLRSRLIDSGKLVVVNLLATPTGHVTNLSADHFDAWSRR